MKLQITIDNTKENVKVITLTTVCDISKVNVTKLPPINLNDLFSSFTSLLKETTNEDIKDDVEEKKDVPKKNKKKEEKK